MTAFTTSQIPSWVDSWEKLFALAAYALNNQYAAVTNIQSLRSDGTGQPTRVITADAVYQTATLTDNTPGSWRCIIYGSLPLDPGFQSSGPIPKWVQSLGSANVPVGFGGS